MRKIILAFMFQSLFFSSLFGQIKQELSLANHRYLKFKIGRLLADYERLLNEVVKASEVHEIDRLLSKYMHLFKSESGAMIVSDLDSTSRKHPSLETAENWDLDKYLKNLIFKLESKGKLKNTIVRISNFHIVKTGFITNSSNDKVQAYVAILFGKEFRESGKVYRFENSFDSIRFSRIATFHIDPLDEGLRLSLISVINSQEPLPPNVETNKDSLILDSYKEVSPPLKSTKSEFSKKFYSFAQDSILLKAWDIKKGGRLRIRTIKPLFILDDNGEEVNELILYPSNSEQKIGTLKSDGSLIPKTIKFVYRVDRPTSFREDIVIEHIDEDGKDSTLKVIEAIADSPPPEIVVKIDEISLPKDTTVISSKEDSVITHYLARPIRADNHSSFFKISIQATKLWDILQIFPSGEFFSFYSAPNEEALITEPIRLDPDSQQKISIDLWVRFDPNLFSINEYLRMSEGEGRRLRKLKGGLQMPISTIKLDSIGLGTLKLTTAEHKTIKVLLKGRIKRWPPVSLLRFGVDSQFLFGNANGELPKASFLSGISVSVFHPWGIGGFASFTLPSVISSPNFSSLGRIGIPSNHYSKFGLKNLKKDPENVELLESVGGICNFSFGAYINPLNWVGAKKENEKITQLYLMLGYSRARLRTWDDKIGNYHGALTPYRVDEESQQDVYSINYTDRIRDGVVVGFVVLPPMKLSQPVNFHFGGGLNSAVDMFFANVGINFSNLFAKRKLEEAYK